MMYYYYNKGATGELEGYNKGATGDKVYQRFKKGGRVAKKQFLDKSVLQDILF